VLHLDEDVQRADVGDTAYGAQVPVSQSAASASGASGSLLLRMSRVMVSAATPRACSLRRHSRLASLDHISRSGKTTALSPFRDVAGIKFGTSPPRALTRLRAELDDRVAGFVRIELRVPEIDYELATRDSAASALLLRYFAAPRIPSTMPLKGPGTIGLSMSATTATRISFVVTPMSVAFGESPFD
jgi:hypothetical protein